LLTLARLEAAPPGAETLSVDLSQITRRVAADLALGALTRHQTLILDAKDACSVKGNDLLLGVLVRNLLDNALRYSPDGAQIEARVEHGATTSTLTVEDAGPGMSEGDRARLGERFFRVLGHEQTGSGLGWSIVKRIADVSGGQVTVSRSDRLGGLAVRVTWPSGA
jgi:two-component system sensor histidine kinase QseC